MKLLITGSGGQLGQEWQKFLKEKEKEYEACTSDALDITDYYKVNTVLSEKSPDCVINCAAYTSVDKADDERKKADRVNHMAVKNLAEVCHKTGIKLVHYSTDYIFKGDATDKLRFSSGYPEEHQADPVNWYGKTKWKGEEAIRNSGCEYLIIRTMWLCGFFGDNFVKTMLRLGTERDEIKVVNDQWGSPSFADEVVKNTFHLIEKNESGTFHLTSHGILTWFDFAGAIFEYSGIDINIIPVGSNEFKTPAKRPEFSKLDTRKAERIEDIEICNWREGLEKLLRQLND